MTEYLVVYVAKSGGNIHNGSINITHDKYFKEYSELEKTRRVIVDALIKETGEKDWKIVITNIIKFPVK